MCRCKHVCNHCFWFCVALILNQGMPVAAVAITSRIFGLGAWAQARPDRGCWLVSVLVVAMATAAAATTVMAALWQAVSPLIVDFQRFVVSTCCLVIGHQTNHGYQSLSGTSSLNMTAQHTECNNCLCTLEAEQ